MSDRPIVDSYWLVDGSVLAGEYPGSAHPEEAGRRLSRFLDAGVVVFIDLTEPGEHGLEPYADLLMQLAAERGLSIEHRRHAIVDGAVPVEPAQLNQILDLIDACRAAQKLPYVHCWGGTGRTGVVAGCYYRRMGHDAASALAELRRRWGTMAKAPFRPGVPETREQVKYIEVWDEGSNKSRPGGLNETIHSHFESSGRGQQPRR